MPLQGCRRPPLATAETPKTRSTAHALDRPAETVRLQEVARYMAQLILQIPATRLLVSLAELRPTSQPLSPVAPSACRSGVLISVLHPATRAVIEQRRSAIDPPWWISVQPATHTTPVAIGLQIRMENQVAPRCQRRHPRRQVHPQRAPSGRHQPNGEPTNRFTNLVRSECVHLCMLLVQRPDPPLAALTSNPHQPRLGSGYGIELEVHPTTRRKLTPSDQGGR